MDKDRNDWTKKKGMKGNNEESRTVEKEKETSRGDEERNVT